MFQLMKNPVVWWPVIINVPIDGGQVSSHEMSVQYEILEEEDYNAIALTPNGETKVLNRVIKDWKHINDVDGKPMAFNQDNLTAVLKKTFAKRSLLNGYLHAAIGEPIKN